MLLPRELIYRERNLEEFRIFDSRSFFHHLYMVISLEDGMTPIDVGCYEKIADTLNTVCYLCTDAILQPIPELAVGDYFNYIVRNNPLPKRPGLDYATIVLNCVKSLVSIIATLSENEKYRDFYDIIVKRLQMWDMDININTRFSEYFKKVDWAGSIWDNQYVTPRPIDDELLKSINWLNLTNEYDLDRIRFIVRNISRYDSIKLKVIEDIRKEVECYNPYPFPF